MPLVIGGMGALAFGASLFSGMAGASQQEAQAIQAQLQQRNAEFQRQSQVQANNRNIDKRNLARAINNKKIEQLGLSERALAEVYQKLGYDNAKGQFSKQTNQVNSALLSSISGRNIDLSSGTARALLRQNIDNATVNMANLRVSNMNKMRDIETTYQNKLSQRDFNFEEHSIFLAGDTSSVSGPSMAQIGISAGLSGLQAGLGAGLMYSKSAFYK